MHPLPRRPADLRRRRHLRRRQDLPRHQLHAYSTATFLRLRSTATYDARHLPATPRVGRPLPARPAARPPFVRPAEALKGGGLLELFELGGRTLGRNGEQRRPQSI